MRVAMMGDYPRDPEHIGGGVDAVIVYLVEGLQKLGDIELHVLTLCSGIERQAVVAQRGITAHYIPADYRLNAVTLDAYHRNVLRRKLAALQPDIVHAHIAGTYAMAAFASGFPSVLTLHGIRRHEMAVLQGWRNQTYRRWLVAYQEWASVRAAKHVIAISPCYIRSQFSRAIRGVIYDIENPIHHAFFDIERCERPNRVLFAGRISRRKGILELLQAIELVQREVPDVQIRLAGRVDTSPTYVEQVRAYVRAHGLEDCVQFLGSLEEAALLGEYASCALLVLASRQETAPMVIAQAMAARVPVVATRVGGVDHLVDDGRTGLVVDFGDITGLAEAMTRLLADASLRAQMGEAGRNEADRRFRAEVVARQTRAVYDDILGRA